MAELGAELHNNSATVLQHQGKSKEARRLFELAIVLEQEALKADPKNSRARDNLVNHYWNLCALTYLEDPDLCGRFARSALDQRPPESKSDFWYFLGWAEYHRGNWQACIQALGKSPEFSQNGSFFGAIAQCHLGDKSAARATFARADKKLREREARSEERPTLPDLGVVRRQRAEAVALLGLSDPPAPEQEPPPRTKGPSR